MLLVNSGKLGTGAPVADDRWPEKDVEGEPFDADAWRYFYAIEDASSTVMCRHFLAAGATPHQMIVDGDCFMIFTNWVSPRWRT
jgi:hypothetical protein